MLMTYTGEKVIYGVATIGGSGFSALGAIMTHGEARYFYVTLAVSIVTAAFCAIVFKRQDEAMRVVVGRCGLSILGGIFGTRYALHKGWLTVVDGDVIILGSQAIVVTILSFFVGFYILHILNRNGKDLADRIFKKWSVDLDGK
jgi:predicted Co/Zn/Cd cation transporter (cation efflux family)